MQSGKTVSTEDGLEMELLDGTKACKWPGCLVSIWNAGNREADWDLRLEATLRPFNKWVNFFDSVVTSVVRFGFFFLVNTNGICQNFENLMCIATNFSVNSPNVCGTNAIERFELWSNRCIFEYWTCV